MKLSNRFTELLEHGLTHVSSDEDLKLKIEAFKGQGITQFYFIKDTGLFSCTNPNRRYYETPNYAQVTLFGEPCTQVINIIKSLSPQQIKEISEYRSHHDGNVRQSFDYLSIGFLFKAIHGLDDIANRIFRSSNLNPFKPIAILHSSSDLNLEDYAVAIVSGELAVKDRYSTLGPDPEAVFASGLRRTPQRAGELPSKIMQLLEVYNSRDALETVLALFNEATTNAEPTTQTYYLNECPEDSYKNPGNTETLFLLPKNKIKSLRKLEGFDASRFSNPRNDSKGFLIANPVKSKSYAKFWFYGERSIDAFDKKLFLETLKESCCILKTTQRSVFKDIWRTKPDDISKVRFTSQEVPTVERINFDYTTNAYLANDSALPAYLYETNFMQVATLEAVYTCINKIKQRDLAAFLLTLDREQAETIVESFIDVAASQVYDKMMIAYNGGIGGKVDANLIKKTKFAPMSVYLTKVQKVKLRQYINSGDVNEDVLNHQPLAVYLLLSTGSSLKNLNKKKTKIFDSMKINAKIPKWFLNKMLDSETLLENETHSLGSRLEASKYIYRAIKKHWGNTQKFAWMLNEDPKIFSQMDYEDVQKLIMWDMTTSKMREQHNWLASPYSYYLRNTHNAPEELNQHTLFNLYMAYTTETGLDKREVKRRELVVKSFFADFQKFWSLSYQRLSPYTTSWVSPQADPKPCVDYCFRPIYSYNNDFFCNAAFLFCYLTNSSPYESFEMFVCFISQILQWFKEAEERHNYRVSREPRRYGEFRPIYDTEEYLRDRINTLEISYTIPRRYNYRINGVNPNTPDEMAAYQNALSTFGTFIFEPRPIGVAAQNGVKVTDEQLRTMRFPVIDGLTVENEKMGFRAIQMLNAAELKEEGQNMSHCVGSYRTSCLNGDKAIIHIEPIAKGLAKNMESTMEVRFLSREENASRYGEAWNNQYNQKLRNYQHRSHRNGTPHAETIKFADWLVKRWNTTATNPNYLGFVKLMEYFDILAKANGGKTLQQQLKTAKPKPESKKEKKPNKEVKLTANIGLLKDVKVKEEQVFNVPVAEPDPNDMVPVQAV
jgi:hypothetical protein